MINFLRLSPIILLTALVMTGNDVTTSAMLSTLYALIIAMTTMKKKYKEVVDCAINNASKMTTVIFVLMLAYAVAETFMVSGVGASVIRLSLSAGVTAKTVAVVALIITAALSTATGTSWGTFASCAPIFLWLSHIVGGNVLLTTAAIAGGSCFGDNIGLISDTTVVSSGLQEVNIIDRIRHQGVWSISCLVVTAIITFIVSVSMGLPSTTGNAAEAINAIPKEALNLLMEQRPSAVVLLEQVESGVPVYMVIPIIIVLGLAIKGMDVFICLGSGVISALVFGLAAGTVTSISDYLALVLSGFQNAGSWSAVLILWVAAFGGIMNMMNAFEPIANFILKCSKKVRHLMFGNGLLCIIGSYALADEMAQIVTIGPIIKKVTEDSVEGSEEDMYKLRLRNATFNDAMGVFGSQIVPWHSYMAFFVSIAASTYPLFQFTAMDIIKHNYMAIVVIGSILILTLTGLDRFIPLFRLPSEPDVRLKTSTKVEAGAVKEM